MANTPLLLLIAVLPALTLCAYVDVGIINGTEAKPHSRPYMVSVQLNNQHICGGFLVSESFVMTAAHCDNGPGMTVVVGVHDLFATDQFTVRMRVRRRLPHPGYNNKTLQHDIMLLQMHGLCRALLVTAIATATFTASFGDEIINGKKAKTNSWQYMASVQSDGKHKCGGFLIHPSFVLTAAHCNEGGAMTVVLGSHNISAQRKNLERYKVQQRFIYRSYREAKSGDDIMLLKLSRDVSLSKYVKTVKIPKKGRIIRPKSKCLVAGWGFTEKNETSDDLLEVSVQTVDPKICQHLWGKKKVTLPRNVICAGGYKSRNGACEKDSGGPLVCNGEAVGIASFNSGNCMRPDRPNVYTQISSYSSWIAETIKK
ncbi:mast cell protease 2-like [Chanos chanos]|uniref:trypsin n=1 Tax=Chanos chanos TaxID=29144 RepID=A0A6J2W468_CHACN|nr:mast cell protease 2-like [Chanos chanos]